MVDGRKLTEIISTSHENVKYLPGVELPSNLLPRRIRAKAAGRRYAVPDVKAVVKDAARTARRKHKRFICPLEIFLLDVSVHVQQMVWILKRLKTIKDLALLAFRPRSWSSSYPISSSGLVTDD